MLTNSRCPPKSQIEKVISVLRMEIVFSMKLTPVVIVLAACVQARCSHVFAYQVFGYNPRPSCPRHI
jgi:hypothetical protein